jgi:hypothetical protein
MGFNSAFKGLMLSAPAAGDLLGLILLYRHVRIWYFVHLKGQKPKNTKKKQDRPES